MSQHGSVSSSSHGSMGELSTPPEVELSELEQRKVVVLGVPWQTEDATLQQHFSHYGAVEEAQIMREKYTGKSRGFGFVTFHNTTDALKAVNSEHCIDGRKCEAKFALPEGKVGSARTTRIFVARIPSSVSDPQFRQYFEQFGICQDCYMPKDPSKQGHRGIGFVTYSSPESVELVMSQTHVLNGNEIAIDRATPKEKVALLPGRLSMSQPNLQLAGGSSHGGGHGGHGSSHGGGQFGMSRGMHINVGASPPGLGNGLLLGMGGGSQHMSHPSLPSGSLGSSGSGLLGGSPGQHMHLMGGPSNGSAHGGSYHGGSGFHSAGQMIGGGNYQGSQSNGGGSYHGSQSNGSGSYHGGHQYGGTAAGLGGHDGSYHGGQHGGSGSFSASLGSAGSASFGSAGMNMNLLAQAQALQQQLSSSAAGQSLLDSSSPSQLISLLSANSAAAAAAGGTSLGRYGSAGQGAGCTPSSHPDLVSLLGQPQEQCVHGGGWLHSSMPSPTPPAPLTSTGSGALGPASARAGPRIFIGKLNKETSEQDVKDHFMRFGFVLDVYLPRDKNNKREHRGFGFVTFETEASIQRVVAHGPHHIRGSAVAIDSAVPRQEEVVLSMDGHQGLTGSDRDTADAIHALEVLSLEGSGHGRGLLRPGLSSGLNIGQPY